MGDLLDQIEETIRALHDWFVWVAIALAWLVVVVTLTAGFVIWGVLRIVALCDINRFPRNPARQDQVHLFGGRPIS